MTNGKDTNESIQYSIGTLTKYGGLVGGIGSVIETDNYLLPILGGLVYLLGSTMQYFSMKKLNDEGINKKFKDLEKILAEEKK